MKKLISSVLYNSLIITALLLFNISRSDFSAFADQDSAVQQNQGSGDSSNGSCCPIELTPEQQARAILDREPSTCCFPEQQAIDKAREILDSNSGPCCFPEQQAVDKAREILDKKSGP